MRESDKQLLDYIQSSYDMFYKNRELPKGYVYKGQYDFILQHGKFYIPQALTKEENTIVNNAIKNLGFTPQPKQCFYNAQMLALADTTKQLKYCEGFGNVVIPCNHAWCVINDKVIDVTWRDKNKNNYFGMFENSYFGFVLSNETIFDKQLQTGFAVSFLDDFNNKYELLKKPFKQQSV